MELNDSTSNPSSSLLATGITLLKLPWVMASVASDNILMGSTSLLAEENARNMANSTLISNTIDKMMMKVLFNCCRW